jgi:platelet-activating factor acetylhydrolase IB subunit alpha
MVLTDRQREDLHAGIYEYLVSRGEAFEEAAKAFAIADPKAAEKKTNNVGKTPLMEKKWTAIPRLQKKVLELERTVAQSAKIHAHRTGDENGSANGGVSRRMLPRLPCSHTLAGHSAPVTCVKVHPVFTVVVSGSDDGTIKVSLGLLAVDMDDMWCRKGCSHNVSLICHSCSNDNSNKRQPVCRSGTMKVEITLKH